MAYIDKKELDKLADLAKMELSEDEKDQLFHDLEKILNHFEELKTIDTENIQPVNGGTDLKNVMREDISENQPLSREEAIKAFPKVKNEFLEVPHVFE